MAKKNKTKVKGKPSKAGQVSRKVGQVISFPLKILQPLIKFLMKEEKRLKKTSG